MMTAQLFRGPHSLYRRYQALLESALTSIAFATVIILAVNSADVFPYNWVIVTGVAMAILGIRWPILAYIIAVTAMLYPIFTINFYLAVLFLAVSALGHRLFVHYLGATTLVLATPFLAQYHLHWLIPILGGLWWGGITGAWIGGVAALWGKVIAGMAGMETDWLVLAGRVPDLAAIATRFEGANSLNTLLLIIEPFASSSTIILYNLLQVVGWAVAGGFVGSLAWRRWVKYSAPWSIMVVTAAGGLIMLVTHVGLPYWLTEAMTESSALASQDPIAPLFSLVVVIIVGTTVYSLRESLDLPVAPKHKLGARRQTGKPGLSQPFKFFKRSSKEPQSQTPSEPVSESIPTSRRPVRVPHHDELPEWEPPKSDSGLIMLEID
ncbi:MAG: hypothetical protein KDJ52_26390 [Anaerolineae bacterium]|nr:hypothetical protein [Anaerolineae bacterium]